jgi:hypothetical protein
LTTLQSFGQSDRAEWGLGQRRGIMKKITAFGLVSVFALTAEAPPPRPVHLDIATAQSDAILVKCIEQRLSGLNVKEVPIDGGGVSLQFSQQMNLFKRAPVEYWNITPKGGVNHVTVAYRHPMSEKTAAKDIRIVGRKCFPYELEAAGGGKLPG